MGYVRFRYLKRYLSLGVYPATDIISNRPYMPVLKGPSYKLSQRWVNFVYATNTANIAKYLLREHSGWVNAVAEDGFPIAESVTMGGNVAEVLEKFGVFYRIKTLKPNSALPDPKDYTLVHKFTCLSSTGVIRLPGYGFDAYYPFITEGDAWVHESEVDYSELKPYPIWPLAGTTPQPPVVVGYLAKTTALVIVYQRPGESKVGTLPAGTIVDVTGEFSGYSKVGDKRYIDSRFLKRI